MNYITSYTVMYYSNYRTTYTKEARQLIELFGWTKYFKYFEIYGGSKVTHFRKFVNLFEL